ncbi:unnamed protein product, partial [Adineta steineri]
EDDVKLKEDITYRIHNRSIPYRGDLIVTKYRLMFVTKPPDPIQVLVVSKLDGRTRISGYVSHNA